MSENNEKVPKIRFPGFTHAWEQRELGESLDNMKSGLSRMLQNDDIGLPVVRANNIIDGVLDMNNDVKYWYRKDPQGAKTENYYIHKDDILVNFINSEAKMGTAAIVLNEPTRDTIYTTNILNLRANGTAEPKFIFALTQTQKYINYVKTITKPAVNQASFTTVDFKKFEFTCPEKSEQKKLGEFFSNLDQLITLHQRKLNDVKNLKSGLLQKMFPKNGEDFPEIRFPGFTDAWEQQELGNMGETFTGLSGKTKEDFGHGDAKFVTYVNVFRNPIADPNGTESVEIDDKQKQVKYGDVFFTTSSETPEEVGMSSVWLENTENIYLNSFCFGYRPTVEFDPYYLAFMLRSPAVRKKFMFLAQGISRYNISKNKVMEMKVSVPDLVEQQKVGAFFKEFDLLITLHRRKLEHLQEQKKSLLQQMFV